jgi:hypothetical protein
MAFITLFPRVLDITQLLLDFKNLGMITRVFTQVVTELDGRTTICSGNLDNNVEGLGLFSGGFADIVI